ncbi:MAG: Hsp20/alpha crystallin family protein [Desulfosalsimonadaceae bacterium]
MINRRFFDWPGSEMRSYFDELDRLRRQIERMVPAREPGTRFAMPGRGVFPLVNLTEDKDNYYLRAELPGVKAEDLNIEATADSISISGERKLPEENENARFHRRERNAGRFSRAVTLPSQVDSDKISANMANGLLTITVPKAESAKPRQIEIK